MRRHCAERIRPDGTKRAACAFQSAPQIGMYEGLWFVNALVLVAWWLVWLIGAWR
jgi:hypothetical protein